VPFTTLLSIWLLVSSALAPLTGIIISLLGMSIFSFDSHMFDHRAGSRWSSSPRHRCARADHGQATRAASGRSAAALIAWSGLPLMLALTLMLESGQAAALRMRTGMLGRY